MRPISWRRANLGEHACRPSASPLPDEPLNNPPVHSPARRRGNGVITRRGAANGLIAAAAVVIVLATLTPSSQAPTRDSFCLICGQLGGVDLVLNVLLFAPLGAGMGLARMRWTTALAFVFFSTVGIELLQLTLITGRDASFGDILANTAGGTLGFLLGERAASLVMPSPRLAFRLAIAWLCVWNLWQVAASYALEPAPTRSRYYGQLARPLGGERGYPGRVLEADVDGQKIPDRDMADPERAFQSLRRSGGAKVGVVVESTDIPRTPRSIVRVADENEEEILLVGRDGARLIFGIRTNASRLKVRQPYFALDGAFPARLPVQADTVRVRAEYVPPGVTMLAVRNGVEIKQHIRLVPWAGWRMLALSNIAHAGGAAAAFLDVLFLALSLTPVGYWLARAAPPGEGRQQLVRRVTPALLLLAAGFLVACVAFRMDSPNALEVVAVVVALMIGAITARCLDSRLQSP